MTMLWGIGAVALVLIGLFVVAVVVAFVLDVLYGVSDSYGA